MLFTENDTLSPSTIITDSPSSRLARCTLSTSSPDHEATLSFSPSIKKRPAIQRKLFEESIVCASAESGAMRKSGRGSLFGSLKIFGNVASCESSGPGSPLRQPLRDTSNTTIEAQKSTPGEKVKKSNPFLLTATANTPKHWSRASANIASEERENHSVAPIPLAKVRRTQSECVNVMQFVAGPLGAISGRLEEAENEQCDQIFWEPSMVSVEDPSSGGEKIGMSLQPSSNLGEICLLPCHSSTKDAIKRLAPATVIDVVDGKYDHMFDKTIIVDCRYPYEYLGGHVPGAVNINTLDAAERFFFTEPPAPGQHVMVIFHCEFSSERAPRMALHVRNMDRMLNGANYPALYFPEIYIMDGGYKNFFEQFKDRCDPPGQYMPMRNPLFKEELKFHQRMKHTNLANQKHRSKLRSVSLKSLRVRKSASLGGWTKEEAASVVVRNCDGASVLTTFMDTTVVKENTNNNQLSSTACANTHLLSHLIPSSDGPEIEIDQGFFADWELS